MSCDRRFRQNFKRKLDWCAFNSGMLLEAGGHRSAICLDHSFLDKSGTKTPGLDRNGLGCAGTVKQGLAILCFAYVAPRIRDARFIFAVQTLPHSTRGRTSLCLEHMKDRRDNRTTKCLRAISDHEEQFLKISTFL